jgi:hypothetical protein
MDEQPEVLIRCACCRRHRRGVATVLLRVVRVPEGWRVFRPTRLPVPVPAWELGLPGRSELGMTTVLGDDSGANPYPGVRFVDVGRDPPRQLRVRCRRCRQERCQWCRSDSMLVQWRRKAGPAVAAGHRDVYA